MNEEASPNDYKSDTPGDRGGRTVMGIAENANGKEMLDRLWPLSYNDALVAVKPLYWHNYWLPIGGPRIADVKYAVSLYDLGVNSGVDKANYFKELCKTSDEICDCRIKMLNDFFPNGYIVDRGTKIERDILPDLKARIERCRNFVVNT